MRCPKDDTELLQSERQGIEIEYCPTCNGAWVDRGDLDELIATAAAAVPDDDDLFATMTRLTSTSLAAVPTRV